MPQMDGIELARRASELDPELKIMFITGFAAVTLNNDSPPPKDARVLSKPFHLQGPRARDRPPAGGLNPASAREGRQTRACNRSDASIASRPFRALPGRIGRVAQR